MNGIDAGTVLASKYRLEALIGRGGMGSVWRAQHLGLSAPVAVKLLDLSAFGALTDALARFHREAQAAATIRSPHVVQILDHGVDPVQELPFIVMELMEGESLADRLRARERLSPAQTALVITHISRALSRAHEAGIVHRDLKPDNVFLVRNEDEEVAKVLDFGIAKAHPSMLGGNAGTRTGAVMGTVYYMSPEQISGAKNVDHRSDLWALGVIAFECLVGARPFEGDSIGGLTLKICVEPLPIPSQRSVVPSGFDEWFARCIQRDPGQRFQSAREAAEALRLLCAGTPSRAPAALTPESARAGAALVAAVPASIAPAQTNGRTTGSSHATAQRSLALWVVGGASLVAVAGAALALRSGAGSAEVTGPVASIKVPTEASSASVAPDAPAADASGAALAPAAISAAPPAPVAETRARPPLTRTVTKVALPRPTAALTAAATSDAKPQAAVAPAAPKGPVTKPRDLIDERH